jgi:hypothetical protein
MKLFAKYFVILLILFFPGRAFMTVGGFEITELKDLVYFSQAIFCGKAVKIEKLKTKPHERRYTFQKGEILFQENDKKFDLKSKDKIEVLSHHLSSKNFKKIDGTMIGIKGPLLLSYSGNIKEEDLKIGQEVIVFVDYGYIKQGQFELAAKNSFENLEKKKEIEKLIEKRLQER